MNQKGFANIALIALVVILAGVAGYFALVKKSEPVVQQTTPPPTTTQTPTPQQPSPAPINETTSWKTYTGNAQSLSFEFNLPTDFSLGKHQELTTNYQYYLDSFTSQSKINQYFSVLITPVAEIRERNRVLSDGKDNSQEPITLGNIIAESHKYNTYLAKVVNKGETTVSGIPAIRQEITIVADSSGGIRISTFLLKDDMLIELSVPKTFDETLYRQILSTFRFTK